MAGQPWIDATLVEGSLQANSDMLIANDQCRCRFFSTSWIEHSGWKAHTEQFIVDALRKAGALAISLVAKEAGAVVGQWLCRAGPASVLRALWLQRCPVGR